MQTRITTLSIILTKHMGKTKTKTSKKTHKTRKLFSPWWLQPTRCQNKCFTSVQGNLLKCNILWCSEVQRDNLRVSFGLNSIHMWFIITTASHSKEGWTLKIGFSKHPCFLQISISQKCSEVATDIPSGNTTFLPVIHQPTATSGVVFFFPLFVFIFPWTKRESMPSFLLNVYFFVTPD